MAEIRVDGRRVRREQNREAVVDALVAMFEEGIYTPSTNEIAERAGISPRSLFRYFDDVDDLNRAAIERELDAARPLFDLHVRPSAPTSEKIAAVVAARVRLHTAGAHAARAARSSAHRRPVVAAQMRDARRFLRRQLAEVFAPELLGRGDETLDAIDALCAFETYDLLHDKTAPAVTAALRALLA